MKGVLVTGTDTGVGKTLVSAALVLSRAGTVYVKPVQTGLADDPADADVVAGLTGCDVRQGPGFDEALAPSVAATRAGQRLTRADLLAPFRNVEQAVGEGAGGLLVDLGTDGTTLADLAVDLSLPLIVVCRPGLGTLNHTRLTLEAAWARGISVLGLVVNGFPGDPDVATSTNLDQLAEMAPVLAVIPRLSELTADALPRIDW
jgi:dethiobiotin synthetase